jgi:oxygen-independent coproporphyrinogen-3 oxidase
MMTTFQDEALIKKYNVKGPRYTSYPTALLLRSGFDPAKALQALNDSGPALSLYLHVPFCRELCYYCGCNKVISRDQTKADRYLDALAREMALYQPACIQKQVHQLHFGGGTPTYLDATQLRRLMLMLRQHFDFLPNAELSIEIDPRSCDVEKLAMLRELGFSRVSFGVQDFDAQVQQTINRVQPYAMVETLVNAARALQFSSINLDLVYGLPHQAAESFAQTLAQVVRLDPDRISLFSYAHLPERFAAQRKIPDDALPSPTEKLELLALAMDRLQQAGFIAIGMDHFAKAADPLTQAQQAHQLTRNFQGYSVDACDTLLGLGVSAISQVGNLIWQQQKDLKHYYQALERDEILAIDKGLCLTRDDQIRADLIARLMCNFVLDTRALADKWQLDFAQYFASSLAQLVPCFEDDLVRWHADVLQVTARGRPWVRIIAAAFDAYLLNQQHSYSKVI